MHASSPLEPFSPPPPWLVPRQREHTLRIPTRLFWAVLVSLLLHALLFWGFLWQVLTPPTTTPPAQPLNIVLNAPVQPQAPPVNDAPPPIPKPPIPKPKTEPKPQPPKPVKNLPKPVMQVPHSNDNFRVPDNTTPPTDPVPPKPPAEDFSSMIKRRQNDRNANEILARRINEEAAAAERGPTEDERRTKNIMNNLKFGTNGLFSIRRMDPLNATFSFKGWTNDYASANTQFYEVEARSGEDIRLVMIRRMIAIIREHYNGDFEWISNRLGRSVTLSARMEDSAGLEDFMMKEFFGPNYKTQDVWR